MTNKFNFIINQNEVKKVHYQHFVKTWVKSYWYDYICMATVHKKAIDSNWLSATQTLKGKAIIRIKKKLFDTTTIRVIIGFDLRGLVKEFDLLNVLIRVSMEFDFWVFEPLRVKCSKLGYFFPCILRLLWQPDILYLLCYPIHARLSSVPKKYFTHFMPLISFDTPENIRKPLVFWCFQGLSKEISGIKWFNKNYTEE